MGWETVIVVATAAVVPGITRLLHAMARRQRDLGKAEVLRAKAEFKKTSEGSKTVRSRGKRDV